MICLQGLNLRELLDTATKSKTLVMVNEPGTMPIPMCFASIEEDDLILGKSPDSELPSLEIPLDLRFRINGTPFRFTSKIKRFIESDLAEAAIPKCIIAMGQREHCRISVPTNYAISGQLVLGDTVFDFECLDVSHLGSKILIRSGEKGQIASGQPGVVTFASADKRVQLKAIVMWHNREAVGLLFPDMRKVSPEDEQHPWLCLLHECLLSSAQPASACCTPASESKVNLS